VQDAAFFYGTSPLKKRSTKAELLELQRGVHKILAAATTQITIRHLFYRLVGGNLLEKTERQYDRLCKHLSNWRKQGVIDWSAFVDSTRWHLREQTFDGIQDAAERTIETYRRDLWSTQPFYVEVWVEKDAIAGLIYDRARLFGVPVFVCRGYASLSSMYSASVLFRRAERAGKLPVIFHLGDYDPSGHGAADSAENSLHEHFGCNLSFERIAVTENQIQELNQPFAESMTALVFYISPNSFLRLTKRSIATIGDITHYFVVTEPFKCTIRIGSPKRP
jgi:hypothetical protein